MLQRLLMAVRQAQRDAEGIVRLGKGRLTIERPGEQADRFVEPALPDAQEPEIVQRLHMDRVAFEDGSVERFGLGQLLLLLQRQRGAKIPSEVSGVSPSGDQAARHGRGGIGAGCADSAGRGCGRLRRQGVGVGARHDRPGGHQVEGATPRRRRRIDDGVDIGRPPLPGLGPHRRRPRRPAWPDRAWPTPRVPG